MVTRKPARTERSDAYSRFVRSDDDIVGAIAYVFYKKQKIEYITRLKCGPNDPRIKNYHRDLNDNRIETLRNEARSRFQGFADGIAAETREKLKQSTQDSVLGKSFSEQAKHLAEIEVAIKDTKMAVISGTKLWKSIVAGVTASIVFGLMLTGAKVISWTNPFDGITSTHESKATGSAPKEDPTSE